jgi:hypothetical protein
MKLNSEYKMKASKIVYGARFLANCPKNTDLIVGLNVALKGPHPLVGESEVSRESDVSRTTPKLLCDRGQELGTTHQITP